MKLENSNKMNKIILKKQAALGEKTVKHEDEISRRLEDSDQSQHEQAKDSKEISEKGERIETDNLEERPRETGGTEVKKDIKNFKTISSQKDDLLEEVLDSSDSFIPFSNRTSLTHIPAIYEEVIQKYENDIRNHIRIEQQMKLHSDSVINKLEDKEKAFDKTCNEIKTLKAKLKDMETKMKCEAKVLKGENNALKKSIEEKIEKILCLETSLKEVSLNYNRLEKEFNTIRSKKYHSGGITPNINETNFKGKILSKTKYKVNSANPNSGRKSNSNSVQLFYSRNIKGPANVGREEFIIPATSTRSPDKMQQTHISNKSVIFTKDGKSPYIQGDLEKLKQYVGMPKSNTRKTIKSALRGKHLHTDTSEERKRIRDYNSVQNSIVYRGTKKPMDAKGHKGKLKNSKPNKHKHFMSYDAKSHNLKYYDFGVHSAADNSMDRIHKKKKMSLSTKMKSKRNSSMVKMLKAHGFMNNTGTLGGYGGVDVNK